MYIVGQEETAGESSVSVVAGVRTVTTHMDGRDVLPRLSRPFAFSTARFHFHLQIQWLRVNVPVNLRRVASPPYVACSETVVGSDTPVVHLQLPSWLRAISNYNRLRLTTIVCQLIRMTPTRGVS